MKIQYLSDLHLEFKENSEYLKKYPIEVSGDILLMAGDTAYLNTPEYENHFFWDWASRIASSSPSSAALINSCISSAL